MIYKIKNIKKLISSILICQLAGIIGSIFTASSISDWYIYLNKPSFNPPSFVFAPVWTLIYILMGIAVYLIWTSDKRRSILPLVIFDIQLILNVLWSILFFGFRNPFIAFIDIILLWIFIVLTIWQFAKVEKKAAYLLIPYILWVSFAVVLNYWIWQLNI